MPQQHERVVKSYWYQFPVIPIITYQRELEKHLKDCDSVLDIGCGGGTPIRYIPFKRAVGVDLDKEYTERARKEKTHHEYHLANVGKIGDMFKNKEFDGCVALDLIEHLTHEDGLQLINDMKKLAKKKIIIFTPNGYMNQKDEEHPLQNHHSGWTVQEMKNLGFEVYGMLGPKALRLDQHVLKGNKYITGVLSEIAQITYIHKMPEKAAAIFCVMHL